MAATGNEDYGVVEFASDAATLRGRLYLPSAKPTGVVILGHGFSATIPMVMNRFAEFFQRHGFAALAFDHRGHGTSDGEPRGEINYWVQARGYSDAITAVGVMDGLDAAPVALWGDSLSARVALGVTALDDRVSALIAQVPAFGDEIIKAHGRAPSDGTQLETIRQFLNAGALRKPQEFWSSASVVSPDQVALPSALEPLTAFRWFVEHGARFGTGWQNRVTFTTPSDAPPFDAAVFAPHVRVPSLFVIAADDEMPGASSTVARIVADRVGGPAEVLESDGGHFGILEHPSDDFTRASSAQVEFLKRVFG